MQALSELRGAGAARAIVLAGTARAFSGGRRHHRVRQADAGAEPARGDRGGRGHADPGGGGDPGRGARRRAGAGARLPRAGRLGRARAWACRRSSWACCPAPAGRSGCRGWWASRRRCSMIVTRQPGQRRGGGRHRAGRRAAGGRVSGRRGRVGARRDGAPPGPRPGREAAAGARTIRA